MQYDHPRGIAVLLDSPNRDAFAFCTFPQGCQELEAFALLPGERVVSGDCVKDVESRPAHTGNAERPVKGVTTCLREIDCAQDFLYRCHIHVSSPVTLGIAYVDACFAGEPASIGKESEHRVVIGCLFRNSLQHVPVLHDFAVHIQAKNIDAGPLAVSGPVLVTVQND